MFKNKIIKYSTLAMVVAILAYFIIETFSPQGNAPGIIATESLDPRIYESGLASDRAESQKWFLTSENSPIIDQDSFEGLSYFEPDLRFRVVADVVPYTGEDKVLEIENTDGTVDIYERHAHINFMINNTPQKLLLLKHEGALSLMWKDGTSGKTTYGGGRYLDFSATDIKRNQMVVDFNYAYNPYCAYNPGFACPLPPSENVLSESITAGEKFLSEK